MIGFGKSKKRGLLAALMLSGCGPKVPNVVGMKGDDAVRELQKAGYMLGNTTVMYTGGVAADTIYSQNPAAGERLKEGRAVDVTIAKALGSLTVPDLTGLTEDQATSVIASMSLVPTSVPLYSETVAKGMVGGQVPIAGSKIDPGAVVAIGVSKGKTPTKVKVPKVTGMKQADAEAAIEKAGLVPNDYPTYSDTIAKGVVGDQSPASGASVSPGSKVGFIVSLGKGTSSVTVPNVKGKTVVLYYAYHLWQIGFTVAPIAVLVGVLVTLGLLARRNEITAMKAGGISVFRAAGPVLGMGVLASLALYGLQEFVLPETNKVAAAQFNVIKGRPAQSSDQFDRRWLVASDDRFYNFDYVVERPGAPAHGVAEPGRGEFAVYGLSIYDIEPKAWELRERTFVSRASWTSASRSYDLEHGWRRTTGAPSSYQPFVHRRVRAIGPDPGGEIEAPPYFRREEKPSDTMGFWELRAYIASLETRGFDVAKHRVQLQRKVAFPMVGLVMTLLAVPFSFVVARRGALYGIGIAIVMAIVYWAVLSSFEALGNNAYLHPALAAWAPNLLFGAAGLYLILTLET